MNSGICVRSYQTALGVLTLRATDDALCGVSFAPADGGRENAVMRAAFAQIEEYLAGRRRDFDIPLKLDGTVFQMSVWKALRAIPYGATATYAEIARAAGNAKAARAAGGALHRNPLAIVVPCHRVIGSNGSLTGFAGGLAIKKYLLNLERLGKS